MSFLLRVQQNKDIIKELYKKGFLSPTLFTYESMSKRVDMYIRQGDTELQAKENTATDFDCSIGTIYNAVKKMR